MEKTVPELYKERAKRIIDAVELRVPDKVPVILETSYFPARYVGLPLAAAWNDYDAWLEANKKTVQDFSPDMVHLSPFVPGSIYEALDLTVLKWPGHGVGPDISHQYVETECMKAHEYDMFIDDPSDFLLRFGTSRTFGAMEPLGALPPLPSVLTGYFGLPILALQLATPPIHNALERLLKVGREMMEWHPKMAAFIAEIEQLGFPQYFKGGMAFAPFDVVSDFMRGMRGAMLDMYRAPDKLLAAVNRITQFQMRDSVASARANGSATVFIPLHRGGSWVHVAEAVRDILLAPTEGCHSRHN